MLLKLALADLKFEKLMSLCIAASIASILAPLLLLFALRTGVLSELERQLTVNPANLEITFGANYSLDAAFIAKLKADPHVGFAVPLTRSLNVTCDVRLKRRVVQQAMAVPTAAQDPVLKAARLPDIQGEEEIYLSESLADKLEARPGDELQAVVSRIVDGKRENGIAAFKVKGVVPRSLLSLDRMLISVNAVTYMEDFRDGYEPPLFSDGSHPNAARTKYAKVRLYAKDIYAVEPLVKSLEKDYRVNSKMAQIAEVKAITAVLNTIFEVIAAVTVTGGALCFVGLTVASLSRKVKSFSLLRLMGLEGGALHALVLLENLLLTAAGFLAAAILCYIGQNIFESLFAAVLEGNRITLLSLPMLGGFLGAALLASAVISLMCTHFSFMKASLADILRME